MQLLHPKRSGWRGGDGADLVDAAREFAAEEGRSVYRRATPSGKFERSFRLPDDADAERVSASYTDGVLEVRVPRSPQLQPRRIPISAT